MNEFRALEFSLMGKLNDMASQRKRIKGNKEISVEDYKIESHQCTAVIKVVVDMFKLTSLYILENEILPSII